MCSILTFASRIQQSNCCFFKNKIHFFTNSVKINQFSTSHTKKCRLTDLIDEYIDHLNYIQDIYTLNIQSLSNILTDQLIRRLFVPVYLSSILNKDKFIIKVSLVLFYSQNVFTLLPFILILRYLGSTADNYSYSGHIPSLARLCYNHLWASFERLVRARFFRSRSGCFRSNVCQDY